MARFGQVPTHDCRQLFKFEEVEIATGLGAKIGHYIYTEAGSDEHRVGWERSHGYQDVH